MHTQNSVKTQNQIEKFPIGRQENTQNFVFQHQKTQ